jgi:SNF2 family DNA or RNA helicase
MTESQLSYYEKTRAKFRNEITKSITDNGIKKSQLLILKGLMQLRQIANHPLLADKEYAGDSGKHQSVFQLAETALNNGHKVLIFSQFVSQLQLVQDHFISKDIPFKYIDGSKSAKLRKKEVDEFQKNERIRLFLISIRAGGIGLNLTAADYVFIMDPWWNPAVENQAMDRTHRIGQDKKVLVYKFISKDTVEEKILALQNKKRNISKHLIESENSFVKSFSSEDLEVVLG